MSADTHIVCPHCDTVNRVPAERLADASRSGTRGAQGQCGKCGKGLFDAKPADVNGERFRRHVGRNGIPVVVDFWAEWCGPCKAMAPEFERAASELGPAARFIKLDTENEQAIAAQFSIRSIPTMVLFRNGREVARRSGAMRAADIVRWVKAQNAA